MSVRFQLEDEAVKKSTWADDEVLPDLPHPFKYRKRGDAISIFREYQDAQGRHHSIQKTLCKSFELQTGRDHYESLIPTLVEDIIKKVKASTDE